MPVTAANLNGTWQLSEWNGQALAEGTYCYITFNRRELTFEMYQKFDSMYARYITGSFSMKTIHIWDMLLAVNMILVMVTGTMTIS